MTRWIVVLVVAVLLVPAAAIAQGDIVDLVISEDQSQVSITDSFESTARVSVTIDGKDYVLEVPVTISVDATVPIAGAAVATDTATRVGVFAIDILETQDVTEAYAIDDFYEVEPSSDANKLIVIWASITNLDSEPQGFAWYVDVLGIDKLGREFETAEIDCDDLNPGATDVCTIVFDVESDVDIVGLDIIADDHKQITLQ